MQISDFRLMIYKKWDTPKTFGQVLTDIYFKINELSKFCPSICRGRLCRVKDRVSPDTV